MKGLFGYVPPVLQQRPLHNPLLPEERDKNPHLKRGHRMQEANLDSEDEAVTTVKAFWVDGRKRRVFSVTVQRS